GGAPPPSRRRPAAARRQLLPRRPRGARGRGAHRNEPGRAALRLPRPLGVARRTARAALPAARTPPPPDPGAGGARQPRLARPREPGPAAGPDPALSRELLAAQG